VSQDKPSLALFQPEIPQNVGTLARMSACFGATLHLIGPLGFVLNDKHFRRAGMDYLDQAALEVHESWAAFGQVVESMRMRQGRLVALTTGADAVYSDVIYRPGDILLAGPESSGLPEAVLGEVDLKVRIPIQPQTRSLNVAIASAIVFGEALRQTRVIP
jgi:tRNA (cytidine/uridine-2'-O-)-methyltransferase